MKRECYHVVNKRNVCIKCGTHLGYETNTPEGYTITISKWPARNRYQSKKDQVAQ